MRQFGDLSNQWQNIHIQNVSRNVNARGILSKMCEHFRGLMSYDLSIYMHLMQVLIHISRCKPTLMGKSEGLVERPSRYHFVHHKTHIDCSGPEPGPPR
jgi:hypothetical protein